MVKAGDTLVRIAKEHQTTVAAIKAANGLTSDRIAVGRSLKIPQLRTVKGQRDMGLNQALGPRGLPNVRA